MFDSVSISTAAHAKPETESVECGFEMSRVIAGNGTFDTCWFSRSSRRNSTVRCVVRV